MNADNERLREMFAEVDKNYPNLRSAIETLVAGIYIFFHTNLAKEMEEDLLQAIPDFILWTIGDEEYPEVEDWEVFMSLGGVISVLALKLKRDFDELQNQEG